MSNGVLINLLTVYDVEDLQAVALQAYKDHYLQLWYDGGEWYIEKSFSITNLSKELKDANAKFYIIYLEDEAVGFLKLNMDTALASAPNLNSLELESWKEYI